MEEYYKKLHQESFVVDGHCDTILDLLESKRSFWKENNEGHLDWPRLNKGGVNLQFLALFIQSRYKPYGSLCRVLELLDSFYLLLEESKLNTDKELKLVLNSKDLLPKLLQETMLLLAVEGGEVLEGKINTLRILYRLGIRSLTLTWNQRNQLANGIDEHDNKGGLTVFGKEVVREMNNLGMLIDVSHISEAGFWDVLNESKKPVAATHSCCRTLCDHPRNLTDSQLKALKENRGIIGINFYPGFLGTEKATIEHIFDHIEHAVETAGEDHVGLGSDFDGMNEVPWGMEDVTKLPKLTELMIKRGWKNEYIKKVLGGNFIRVLREVLAES